MRKPIFALLALLATPALYAQDTPAEGAVVVPVTVGSAEAGAKRAYTCTGCHGIPGYNNVYPTFHVPKLGGQNEQYVITALQAYRSGERAHPTMQAQAGTLTDAEIRDIAAYFTAVAAEIDLPEPEARPVPESAQVCAGCHGADGVGVNPTYPKLAGQYADYLLHSLKAYKSGARNNAIMSGIAATLSEEQMEELAEYYAELEALVDLDID